MADLNEDLKLLVRTRHAIVTIQTTDETFATRMLCETARDLARPLLQWTLTEGIVRIEPPAQGGIANTKSLTGALGFLRSNNAQNLYLLKDSLVHLADPTAQRLLRDVAMSYAKDSRTIFLLDAAGELPEALHCLAVPYELKLPEPKEIFSLVKKTFQELTASHRTAVQMNRKELDQFVANLQGLTRTEISQAVTEAVLSDGKLDADDVACVIDLKRRRLRQTGVLDYIPPPEVAAKIGGMKNLRSWLKVREKALTAEARAYGLESPRGILMLGVQGCGKSLLARAVGTQWKLPLLRMDVGALFDKYVGESEKHLRKAFQIASAMAPCVLWIDEIEKAFASAAAGASGAASDGGLSQRMFGQLLTWMQDHKDPVFLVATANEINALPPELMRKGRFDEIFFVDLPKTTARKEIFRIHLTKRKKDPADFDIAALAAAAEGFSGSEIEQAIVAAMYAAFAEDRPVTGQDILQEIRSTQPLSVVMAEKIASLRNWAHGRCVSAEG